MNCLPDTSAMVKRYFVEGGSERVLEVFFTPGMTVYAGQLVRTELASALGRRVREGSLSLHESDVLMRTFLSHERRVYTPLALTSRVQRRAESLLFRHALRAADAIHVANALELLALLSEPLIFLTADRRQADAAEAEGLTVEFVG